jgi:hypothetical protein
MTTDQGYGHRLFDRIQKQPPARKSSHHLGMNGRNQRTQAGVGKLSVGAQFDFATRFARSGDQCCIGNTQLQMRYVHESDPLSLMTIAQC